MPLNPRNPIRNIHATQPNRMARLAAALSILGLLGATATAAQDYGSHTLPADLADPAAKVLGVLNKDPKNASRTLGYCEGPAADSAGNLYFTEDIGSSGNIWKVTPEGVGSNFYTGPALPNGLEFDPQGRLTAAEQGGVSTYDKSGVRTPLVMQGGDLKRVNDVTIANDGGMWFTNHSFGNTYFYRSPAGIVTSYPNTNDLGVKVPNGIEFIEEKKLLLVNSSDDGKVYQFDVGDDRKPSNKRVFSSVNVPDGLTVDEKGNVYVASYMEGTISVFDPTGKTLLGKITVKGNATPEANTSNCAFGGPGGKTLYMTGDAGAFKLQMKVAGRKRPGTTSLRPDTRFPLAAPLRGSTTVSRRGYTLSGRKAAAGVPAALILVTSLLSP
ncbi:MAG: Gluconolactonase [Fibrobacteres bacterium]|nr:Gluconolactonase [Fibrobacterota bacterium]